MLRNMLFCILLSSAIPTYAQDSLSIRKQLADISNKQTAKNNIKHMDFPKSMYEIRGSSQNPTIAWEPEITISEYTASELTSNWFINAAGGASAFLGNPLGCEDLFGRIRPMFHLSVGKWFSPTAGGRIAFQGFYLKNHSIEQQDYYHLHADFLWNVTNLFRKEKPATRWQFIPFAGTGIIQNKATRQHPFTLNYGILNHLTLTDRLSLSFELGGLTTFGNFDGAGKGNKFTDHLFHLSAGVSITLGNKGWSYQKKRFNDLLVLNNNLSLRNRQLEKENGQNSLIMSQIRKILEIEGLLSRLQGELEKSGLTLLSGDTVSANNMIYYPRNDYSGLNSLRKRLLSTVQNPDENNRSNTDKSNELLPEEENSGWTIIISDTLATIQDSLSNARLNNILGNNRNYISSMIDYKACVGSPILFFFHIGTSDLTDSSQLANLDEIVRICNKYDLLLKVTGYADNATGDSIGNSVLSNQRAHYIASELKKRNICEKTIKLDSKGGVDTYSPEKVNRCAKIEIYLKR